MGSIEVSVGIDAPAPKVFEVLCDVERWPQWTSTMQSVRRLDAGPLKVGSRARVVQPKLRPSIWQVTAMHSGQRFNWVARAPGVKMEAGHAVEPNESGCKVTLTFHVTGFMSAIVGRLYGGLITAYLNTEAQGLKQRCEG
jgi:uncharacterized membrane protein